MDGGYEGLICEYEKNLKNMQRENECSKNEYEVNECFPPKPPLGYQYLFDCRLKLLLYEAETINAGETKQMPTTCVIAPNCSWILSIKPNPEHSLMIQEEYIKSSLYKYRVIVSVTNITSEIKFLPKGLCIGYLLLQ